MSRDVEGRTVLDTGAARGIGAESAQRLGVPQPLTEASGTAGALDGQDQRLGIAMPAAPALATQETR